MAPLGGHESDRSLSRIEQWMRRRPCLNLKRKPLKRPLTASNGSSDETRSLPGTAGSQPPLESSSGSPDGDPSRDWALQDHPSVRSGRVRTGLSWLMTMTSTARLRSKCQTLNESPTPRMSRRFWSKPESSPNWTIPISCRFSTWDAPTMDSVSSCRSSSKAAIWRSGSDRIDLPSGFGGTGRHHCRRLALCPHPRAGPPGHQARQHPDRRFGQTVCGGFRARPQG